MGLRVFLEFLIVSSIVFFNLNINIVYFWPPHDTGNKFCFILPCFWHLPLIQGIYYK
jgi:hypothetical protein